MASPMEQDFQQEKLERAENNENLEDRNSVGPLLQQTDNETLKALRQMDVSRTSNDNMPPLELVDTKNSPEQLSETSPVGAENRTVINPELRNRVFGPAPSSEALSEFSNSYINASPAERRELQDRVANLPDERRWNLTNDIAREGALNPGSRNGVQEFLTDNFGSMGSNIQRISEQTRSRQQRELLLPVTQAVNALTGLSAAQIDRTGIEALVPGRTPDSDRGRQLTAQALSNRGVAMQWDSSGPNQGNILLVPRDGTSGLMMAIRGERGQESRSALAYNVALAADSSGNPRWITTGTSARGIGSVTDEIRRRLR